MRHAQHGHHGFCRHHHDDFDFEDDEGRGRRGGRFGRGFGPHGRGMGRGRGRGRGRIMDAQELRLLLLKLMADEPRHGYDLIQAISELTGSAYAPSPGMVYPALSMLEDTGLIEPVESDGKRKAFTVTEAGRADVEANAEVIADVQERLAALTPAEEGPDAAPVKRAMQGLRTALRTALRRPDARQDMVHDIAAILDSAAQQIERLK